MVTLGDSKGERKILSVTEAANVANAPKGTVSRWRKKHELAVGDGPQIDQDKLVEFLKTHQRPVSKKRPPAHNSAARAGKADDGPVDLHYLVSNFLRHNPRGATREQIVAHVRDMQADVETRDVDRVLSNTECFQLRPNGPDGKTVYVIHDD
jgi:hypothetical protein